MPARPLVAARFARPAWITAAVALAVLVAMGIWLHNRRATAFDVWWSTKLFWHVGSGTSRVLVDLSLPVISVVVPAVVLVAALFTRRWNLAVLAVVLPVSATVLAEQVGKPLVHRLLGAASSFPSGHETGISCAAFVLCTAVAQLPVRLGARLVVWVLSLAWVLAAAAGLVRGGYHYATDAVGALALTTCLGLAITLVIDQVSERARSRRRDKSEYALS
ncbi:phosphatase PAP2 family protein [uncultured Jatrophihabitans sp.]|uniref:phosphatase PAP2 family protein n=1 Tax=uncultured Jatrophihabitans sp. TaxID=1610747 RepID=UPI0035C9FD5C